MPLAKLLSFRSWSLKELTSPWHGPSLFQFVSENGGSAELPDTPKQGENKIGWVAGAMDGVTGRGFMDAGARDEKKQTQDLLTALAQLVKRSSEVNLTRLHELAASQPLLPVSGELKGEVRAKLLARYKPRIAEVGRLLMLKGSQREAVKLGILLLGLAGNDGDSDALELLATHDELTLYAALSLAELVPDPVETLWRVAKTVHGWGRVEVVERLSGTRNRDVQAWMLREGFRNDIMDEYLAGICAKTGQLHEVLQAPQIHPELLDGAAGIIKALVYGGPAESIDDYPQGSQAVAAYLRHAERTADLSLDHLRCIAVLKSFVSDDEGWGERAATGWSEELRRQVLSACGQLMSRPEWAEKISAGLASADERVFYKADTAAQDLGINTREIHFAKVRAAPLKSSSWYGLLQQTDEDQIDQVLSFAESVLPLRGIASGPKDALGFGEQYEAHRALDWILQDLKRFPERGWSLLRAGLQSPVTRNRNMALSALLKWPREAWPAEAEWLLAAAWKGEPNKDLRTRLEKAKGIVEEG